MFSFSAQTPRVAVSLNKHAKEIEQKEKQAIVKEFESIISQRISAAGTPREKQGVINAAKSALRNVQRHLNYGGGILFHRYRYNEGNIDEIFFRTLMDHNLDGLRAICTPDSVGSALRHKVVGSVSSLFGSWRTCYTEYAKNLRTFLDEHEERLKGEDMMEPPILNVPQGAVVGVPVDRQSYNTPVMGVPVAAAAPHGRLAVMPQGYDTDVDDL